MRSQYQVIISIPAPGKGTADNPARSLPTALGSSEHAGRQAPAVPARLSQAGRDGHRPCGRTPIPAAMATSR